MRRLATSPAEPSIDASLDAIGEPLLDARGHLRHDFDLLAAATALLRALIAHRGDDRGATMLNRIARRFGAELYPVFVKLLCVVGESDDDRAKTIVCAAFAAAIERGEVPSGALTSWGIPVAWAGLQVDAGRRAFGTVPKRNLDPIEYVTTWFRQSTHRAMLHEALYLQLLAPLLDVFDPVPAARVLYARRLDNDVAAQPPGTFTETTRARLAWIAQQWPRGRSGVEIARESVAIVATRPFK